RLLVSHPDLILLDEPTNHLDIAAIGWLETFLINYKGAVLVVAHDRYFLDRIVTKVVEIRDHRAAVYKGNYSYYASRAEMRITLAPSITSGKDVLHVEGLKKTYGDQLLFQDLSLDIRRGEHVALIGENGTGKTTLLKILNQVIDADDGLFRLGMNVVIGYYDQELQDLHPKMTLFDEIAEERPDLTQTQIRNLLAAFLFRGDEVFLSVGDLSGGERGRLSLAKLMLSESNFLLLDEPTNHLDTESREILESALNQYEGTVLFVSHDRYFINKTASRILEFNNGKLTEYLGNYDYYLEKKAEQGNVPGYSEYGGGQSTVIKTAAYCSRDVTTGEGADSSGRAEWVAQKEEQARIKKLQNRIERTEQEITALEEHLDQIDKEFQKPEVATNPSLLSELHEERSEISAQLEELYAEWETLADASKSP
ncbi:MAG: ABC-F family ATP-binding cassette domain-containing protein, partial [Lachnospiraceae bacterium]|nr:ABC-F family ATP-binding cassette domain-containing protein [Lachnospiraceae bacterium]